MGVIRTYIKIYLSDQLLNNTDIIVEMRDFLIKMPRVGEAAPGAQPFSITGPPARRRFATGRRLLQVADSNFPPQKEPVALAT